MRRGGQEALDDGRLAEVERVRFEPAPGGSDRESDAKVCWGIGRLEVDMCQRNISVAASGREGSASGRSAGYISGESSETLCLVIFEQRFRQNAALREHPLGRIGIASNRRSKTWRWH